MNDSWLLLWFWRVERRIAQGGPLRLSRDEEWQGSGRPARKPAEVPKSPCRPGVHFVAPRRKSQYPLPVGESFWQCTIPNTSSRRRPCRSSRRGNSASTTAGSRRLKGVSLPVEKGQIYGLLGQNGAGKTTLIKILLGIATKTDGDAALLGAAGRHAPRPPPRRLPARGPPVPRLPHRLLADGLLRQLYGVPRTTGGGRSPRRSNWSASPAACTPRSRRTRRA